jgi:hypothetical protein
MKDKDLGYRALKKRLNEFKKSVIKVGIQGKEAQVVNNIRAKQNESIRAAKEVLEKGSSKPKTIKAVTVVTYAAANEFGAKAGRNGKVTIPERSFIRSTTDKKDYWQKEVEKAYGNIIDGKDTALSAIAKVGIIARDDIKKTISEGVPPPNAPITIAKKTVGGKVGNHPLIDTGIMRQSVTYKFADDDGY